MMKKRLLLCLLLCAVFLLPACGGKQKAPQVEVYVQEHWAQYAPFAYKNGVLTLTMRSTMRYDSACKLGGSVYEGELSPESYLDTVRIIALEIASACELPELTVTLQCLSADEQIIFSVCSDGSIETCWEDAQ